MLSLVRSQRRSQVPLDASCASYCTAPCCKELYSEAELCSPQVLVLVRKSQSYNFFHDHKLPFDSAGGGW